MNTFRPAACIALLGLIVSSILITGDTSAQEAAKGRQAAADPEGRAIRKALPDSVRVERDLVFASYGERKVLLDLYLPKQPGAAKVPCIVVIHGGGWRSGDKTRFAALAGRLAAQGFATACIGYRLLPEVQFPAPVADCKAAVRWVRANAAQYGIDPDRIGAIGGSAGAHLAAMLGTSGKEPKLEGDGGNPSVSSRVQAVVAMATPADMASFAQRTKVDKDLAALISPVTYVSKDSAPILLLHGTKDGTVPIGQSELLLEKYSKAGAHAEFIRIDDAPHAFWNGQWFDETVKRAIDFFNQQLGSTSPGSASIKRADRGHRPVNESDAPPVVRIYETSFPRSASAAPRRLFIFHRGGRAGAGSGHVQGLREG